MNWHLLLTLTFLLMFFGLIAGGSAWHYFYREKKNEQERELASLIDQLKAQNRKSEETLDSALAALSQVKKTHQ